MVTEWKHRTAIKGKSYVDWWKDFFEIYMSKEITKMQLEQIPELTIDVKNKLVWIYDMNLMYALFNEPDKAIADAKEALPKVLTLFDWEEDYEILRKAELRFVNLPSFRRFKVKDISDSEINRFFAVEGIIRKVSSVRPMFVEIAMVCTECGHTERFVTTNRAVKYSKKCPYCKKKSLEIDWNESKTTNFQKIEIQDLPENLDSGEQPRLLEVILTGRLAGTVRAGDKVIINGILRPSRKLKKLGDGEIQADFDVFMEANSIEFLSQDVRSIQITNKDVQKIEELANRSDIYDLLVKSIAPSIYGYDQLKLGIALSLFGGCGVTLKDGTRRRGDIHILMVGDPALGKSQILRSVAQIAPRAVLTTGYTSSGAGLTVAVVKDESGRWTLEAGALVLADNGVCIADEIEKMSKDDRKYMLEALEQQTITVSKAGINATLNARCTLIAGANPKKGRFNRYEPITDQIDIEPPLLSRFDLVFVLMDIPNSDKDSAIVDHILNLSKASTEPPIPPDLLKKYILHARRTITHVELDESAKRRIREFYLALRKNSEEEGVLSITTRQLEGLIRLTQASARVRLSNVATIEDAERAIAIFKASMEQVAIDPEKGVIDVDIVMTGMPTSMKEKMARVKKIIRDLQDAGKYGAPEDEVITTAMSELKLSREKVEEIIHRLRMDGDIYMPRNGFYRIAKED